jgi:hypothetical protein
MASATGPQSFAVVGLPGFRPEVALDNALTQLGQSSHVVVHRLKIGSLQPTRIAADILRALTPSFEDSMELPLGVILSRLQEAGSKLSPGQLFVVIEDFHQFAELRTTNNQEVLDLLDCWQAACTEGQWMRVAVCSRMQPALVCANACWSEFYKVFGINIFKAGLLDRGWEELARQTLSSHGVSVSAGVLNELSKLAGGVPDFVVEMLGWLQRGPVTEGDLRRLAGESTFFDERLRAMLNWLPPETRDFFEQGNWRNPTPQHRQSARDCRTSGLLVECDGRLELPTPLLAPSDSEEASEDSASSFVHYAHLAMDHQPLIRKLCSDTYYTKLESVQCRPGEAHVLRLSRENKDGRPLPPRVIKVWAKTKLEKERANHKKARDLLGTSCPQVIGFAEAGADAAMLIEYACADNRDYKVYTFEELCHEHAIARNQLAIHHNQPLPEPVDVVERLLKYVLAGLYRHARLKEDFLSRNYFLPAVRKDNDELELISELSRQTGNLSADGKTLVFGAERLFEPGKLHRERRKELFEGKMPILICDLVHRDLNVRNFLVDGARNIHVIDFSSLKEGPLLMDFARLECEVLLKLTAIADLAGYVAVLRRLLESDLVKSAKQLVESISNPQLRMAVQIIETIRRIASEYASEAKVKEMYSFEADYLGGLAATAGRVALFHNYLEKDQIAAALSYTSLAATRLLELQSRRQLPEINLAK